MKGIECKAIGSYEGNPKIDMWCSDTCGKGECPKSWCKCAPVWENNESTTSKSAIDYKNSESKNSENEDYYGMETNFRQMLINF